MNENNNKNENKTPSTILCVSKQNGMCRPGLNHVVMPKYKCKQNKIKVNYQFDQDGGPCNTLSQNECVY